MVLIAEVDPVCNLLAKAVTFAGVPKDGWYQSSAELDNFPRRVAILTLKHTEWIDLLRKFGRSDDDKLSAFVHEAEKILSDEQKHVSSLQKSRLARWRQRTFPGRLTQILETMEAIVDAGLQQLKSRDEMFGLLERNLNQTEMPLPFQRDDKYVPIARSVAEVQMAVESEKGPRVVIVYGDGGLGKTSLVKYVALHYHEVNTEGPQAEGAASQLFPDGVFYLRCGMGASARIKELERELLESLGSGSEAGTGISEGMGGNNYHRSLRFKLARRKALIIYDDVHNCEVLERLLIPSAAVTYLITSRRKDIWPDRDARKIPLEKPSLDDARKILAMYTELPDDIEAIVTSIINGVGFHPLMLANLGMAVGATRGKSSDEWRRMASGWQDELRERDFKFGPILYGQSYQISMADTMNLMMESLEEGERRFLLLMSLLDSDGVSEIVFKFFRKCMEPGEPSFDYRRYRNRLHNISLLEVYSRRVPSASDTKHSQTYFTIHRLRALCIRKNHSEQLRSMVIKALKPACLTNNHSASSSMTGRGFQETIAATIDALRSLVIRRVPGPINCHTGNSMTSGTENCEEGDNRASQVLTVIMAGMYFDGTLWGAAEHNAHRPLKRPCIDVSIIPKSVRADVDVIKLMERAQEKRDCFGGLVELLDPDGEEEWNRKAEYYASKIIVRFICRQELDDKSVAQLLQFQQTTAIICEYLGVIFSRGYWVSEFVDQNRTFSSAHSATTENLLKLLLSDTTPVNILDGVIGSLCGVQFRLGALFYEDEDTILNIAETVMKSIAEGPNGALQNAVIERFFFFPNRLSMVMRKIPDLWKRVLRSFLDKATSDKVRIDSRSSWRFTRMNMTTFASEIVAIPGALDMLYASLGSNNAIREWNALETLLRSTRYLSREDKCRVCVNRNGLERLLHIATSIQEGGIERWPSMSSTTKRPKQWERTRNAVEILGSLAGTKEVREMILHSCPAILERLQILERWILDVLEGLQYSTVDYHHDPLLESIVRTRTIFNPTLVCGRITDYNPATCPSLVCVMLRGRVRGYLELEMYKEALDVWYDVNFDMDSYTGDIIRGSVSGCLDMDLYKEAPDMWCDINFDMDPDTDLNIRHLIIFAKAMVKDYVGALLMATDALKAQQKDPHDLFLGQAYGLRGVLTRLTGGSLAQAVADLDLSLRLIRAYFFRHTHTGIPVHIYYVLKQRGFVKHLMGDDNGAREDAQTAQELYSRNLVWDGHPVCDSNFSRVLALQLPVDFLGFEFSL